MKDGTTKCFINNSNHRPVVEVIRWTKKKESEKTWIEENRENTAKIDLSVLFVNLPIYTMV